MPEGCSGWQDSSCCGPETGLPALERQGTQLSWRLVLAGRPRGAGSRLSRAPGLFWPVCTRAVGGLGQGALRPQDCRMKGGPWDAVEEPELQNIPHRPTSKYNGNILSVTTTWGAVMGWPGCRRLEGECGLRYPRCQAPMIAERAMRLDGCF